MQADIGTQEYWNATAFAAATAAAVADVAAAPQKDPVTLYEDDGGMYQGHVNEHGAKHGQGTLKTAIYITGLVGDENSHLMRWTEYSGNWDNGLLHGQGIMRHVFGNGAFKVVHDGMWDNGVPVYDDAYYDRMEGSETPQRGDYDHSEEAS